jgi:hypothetical protein
VVERIDCVAAMVVGNGDVVELQRWWGDMSVWWEWVDVVLMLPLS